MDEKINNDVEVGKEQLIKEMLILPNSIKSLRKEVISTEEKYSELIYERKEIELEVQQQVAEETVKKDNDKEKLAFTNAMQKEYEVKKRLKVNDKYQKLKISEKETKKANTMTKNDIEFCFNRLKSLRMIAPFFYDAKE